MTTYSVATRAVLRALDKETSNMTGAWESLPLDNLDDFRTRAQAYLGDKTELSSRTILRAHYPDILAYYREQAAGEPTETSRTEEVDTDPAGTEDYSQGTTTTEGATIMASNAQDIAGITEQIEANIERAKSLAEAENLESLAELAGETEHLISTLPTRGKIGGTTAAKAKQEFRAAFKVASTIQEKPEPAPKAEVATLETRDYAAVEGISDLIAMGAERMVDGVKMHMRTADLARDTARVILDMRVRMTDKDGNPDLTTRSHGGKMATRELYQTVGTNLQGAGDEYDVVTAVKKLTRSVQNVMSDVMAEYLRSLDSDAEEAARFAKVAENKPEDVALSAWVANHYGLSLKGALELDRAAYYAKKELPAGESAGGGEGEGEEAGEAEGPDARTLVAHYIQTIARANKEVKADAFAGLDADAKQAAMTELEAQLKVIREVVSALSV